MAVTYTTLSKFAVDILDGNGMQVFPVQPNDMKVILPSDPMLFVNGTQGIPQFWDVILSFTVMHKKKYQSFAKLWKPGGQKVKLNLQSMVNPLEPATGADGSGWFQADGIWRLPPASTIGQIRGAVVYDLSLTFNRVELDWLSTPVA